MDPDPGGPKTCGSGSGFGSGSATLEYWIFKNVIYRSAEEQLLKLRKYEYQMFLDNKLPPPFSSARAQAARYSAGIFKQSGPVRNRVVVSDRQATQAGGIGSFESILCLLKSLKM